MQRQYFLNIQTLSRPAPALDLDVNLPNIPYLSSAILNLTFPVKQQ